MRIHRIDRSTASTPSPSEARSPPEAATQIGQSPFGARSATTPEPGVNHRPTLFHMPESLRPVLGYRVKSLFFERLQDRAGDGAGRAPARGNETPERFTHL